MARRERDASNAATLTESGWGVLVIWECEIKDQEKLRQTICEFLDQ